MAVYNETYFLWCLIGLLTYLTFDLVVEAQDTGACRSRACYPLSQDLLQNLAGRTVDASSICGTPAEVFDLRFAGEFQDTYQATECDSADLSLSHSTENLFDFSTQNLFGNIYTRPRLDTWWQSVNGEQNVALTVTFGDTFLFQETTLSFRSVRPLAMKIEKSNDNGQTWEALHYYAENCGVSFAGIATTETRYDIPFCEQKYYYGDSTTAATGQDIQSVKYTPAADQGQSFYQATVMRYFSMTDMRIVLVETGQAAPPTRSYFAVADWAVTGQCLCFGHALECTGPNEAECVCQHNTQGLNCEECQPLFNNRPWEAGRGTNENACEDCGCNGFATLCIYDEVKGYGVCQDCTGNTSGDKCEMCINDFYRNPNYTNPNVNNGNTCIDSEAPYPCSQYCWPCDCSVDGIVPNSVCNETNGQCECKVNVQGRICDECKDTFFNLQTANAVGCQPCDCDPTGSLGSTNFCDKTSGQCICKTNVMGTRCDTCMVGTFNLDIDNPDGCTACECDIGGAIGDQCVRTPGSISGGSCTCRNNIAGRMCDTADLGFFVPKLDGSLYEAEFAENSGGVIIEEMPIDVDDSDNITSRHTGKGFMVVSPNQRVTFPAVAVPRNQRYAVVLRHQSASTWSGISVAMTPRDATEFVCNGITIQGVAVGLSGQITQANMMGGATDFGTDTVPCLKGGFYDVTVTFGFSSGGSTDTLLLDSLVLIPRLEDVDIFTSLDTPEETKLTMQECWDASIRAQDPLRGSMACNVTEFSVMAVVYDGAIGFMASYRQQPALVYEVRTINSALCLSRPSIRESVCQCQNAPPGKIPDFPLPALDRGCSCNPLGSQFNTQCDPHGGQCQCQPGVLGRSCDTCTANHYGFNTGSGCTACNCNDLGSVRLSCNQTSGNCECKTNVIGDKCDACQVEHYGLATGNGCQQCTCALDYSLDNQCDDTGQCSCKPGVSGMNCDQCASGFFNLTTSGCITCGCSFDGITEDAGCDNSGQCQCREDATGEQCDTCPAETYGFGPWSERGCIQCYCSGHTSNCTEASGWFEASIESRFSLTNSGAVLPRWTGMDRDTNTTVEVHDVPVLSISNPRIILEIIDPSNLTSLFFQSPEPYQGDKRTAYGQNFIFSLSQSTISDPLLDSIGDVFIYSRFAEMPLAASLPEPPGLTETLYGFKLHENYWRKGTATGLQPTMEEMIHVLAGIESIQIRAKYTMLPGESVFLHESALQFAVDSTGDVNMDAIETDVPALFVEKCNCPAEYDGSFCQYCAPGFRFQSTTLGPFSGCIPCNCNGHTDLPCDWETGICQDCLHNTAGDLCEICMDGYYGDATGGTEDDCQPCMCPGPPGTNSFAATCDNNGNCVACADGHSGNNCETCIQGYYGVPTDIENNGGQCQPCFCSLSPSECDSLSGQCMNCIGNTGGMMCEVCDNGFWGRISNCQVCDCDLLGGDGNCTQDEGICDCYPNVMGDRCDSCVPNSWGFNSGEPGCTSCDCHPIGTVFGASQCNMETGQCECKERVTGLRCDACIDGFWNVEQGCIPCECNLDGTLASACDANGACTCDVTSGQCTCMLDSIAGRTCDRCGRIGDDMAVVEEVFVGAYPNCEPCPECYQNWRNTLTELDANFAVQQQSLMDLLSNYGSLTVEEVDQTLVYISGNLSYAETAIQAATNEAGDLEAIKQGFEQISMGIANFTLLLEAVKAREVTVAQSVDEIKAFDGNVVVAGQTRNAAQLQQELDTLVNTQETIYRLANGSWVTIQEMYALVESHEVRIQNLDIAVSNLLDDTQRAAEERLDARNVIVNDQRDVEFGENFQRLGQINDIQQGYTLQPAQVAAQVAQAEMRLANTSANGARELATQKKSEAQARAYQTEMARYNASQAEIAANGSRTAAMTYKDIALGNKQTMSDLYLEVLDINRRLNDANTLTSRILITSSTVSAISFPPPEAMTLLVNEINLVAVDPQDVEIYNNDATAGLKTAEETRNTSRDAQMESSSVQAIINTLEYEISQAGVKRADALVSLDTSDGYVTNINDIAQWVTSRGEGATVVGQITSDDVSLIRQDAQTNEQCLTSKRNQAENAAGRADSAKMQAEAAQQAYLEDVEDQRILHNLISEETTLSAAAADAVKVVSDEANALSDSVIATKQMEDLNALMNQYMAQRNEMQQLRSTLSTLETDLDAILNNLEGADSGSIRCNENL